MLWILTDEGIEGWSPYRACAGEIILTGPLDTLKGGFTGVLKTAHLCGGFGWMCAMHGGSIGSLHAALAAYNTKHLKRIVPARGCTPPGIQDASTDIGSDGVARALSGNPH